MERRRKSCVVHFLYFDVHILVENWCVEQIWVDLSWYYNVYAFMYVADTYSLLLSCFAARTINWKQKICWVTNIVKVFSNTCSVTVRWAEMKDWVLVLYGTEVHPQDMATTTTTTTTAVNRNSLNKRHNKGAFPDLPILAVNNDLRRYPTPYHGNGNRPKIYPQQPYNPYSDHNRADDYYYDLHPSHEKHICIFETLAKKNNMSTGEYLRMVRSNLSEGKPYCLLHAWLLTAVVCQVLVVLSTLFCGPMCRKTLWYYHLILSKISTFTFTTYFFCSTQMYWN